MKNPFTFSQSSRLVRWGAIVLSIVLLLALISWLTVPSFLKSTLEKQVAEKTGRQFTVGSVAFNPFTLTVNLSQIQFMEADKKSAAFSADDLELKVSLASVFRAAPVIREIKLTHPHLQLMRATQDGKEITNFSDVITLLAQHPGSGDPVRFSVSNIQLNNGAIEIDDHIARKQIHVESLDIALPFISNFPTALDVYVEPYLAATINGSKIELKGRSKPFTQALDTDLAIDINQFNIAELTAFSPKPLPFKVKSAHLSTHLNLNFSAQKDDQRISLSGTVNLNDVVLEDHSGAPLYSSKQINLNLQEANLINQRIAVNVLEIVDPQVWAGLDQHGVLNWLALQSGAAEAKPATAEAPKANPASIELTHFQLKNGTAHWSDAANATPAAQLDITDIAIDAQKISTGKKAQPAKIKIAFGQEHHQHFQFEGALDLATTSVAGELALSDFSVADYQPYANRFIDANVTGKLGLKTHLEVQGAKINLSGLSASLDELIVQPNRHEFGTISAQKIALDNLNVNTETRQANIGKLTLNQMHGDLFRTADGAVNMAQLMKKSTGSPAATQAAGAKSASPWQAGVDQILLSDSSFTFGDKGVQPAVMMKADGVNIELDNVSSNLNQAVKFDARLVLNKTGKFAVNGSASGKAAQVNLDVQNFAFAPLQPYFTQFLNITLEKGNLSTKGKISWQAPGVIQYQGGLKLANFATSDKETSDDFLVWKSLDISGIDVQLGGKQPVVTLGKIDLTEFYARAILSEQGKLNLQDIVAHSAAPKPADASAPAVANSGASSPTASAPAVESAPAAPAAVITIGAINLNNGVVNYTDNFINPHYSMRMTGMTGTVGAIHSDQALSAPIDINGKVDDEAPIEISGSLNPLFKPMLLDMKLTATGVDLPRLTTYALKYAGYPIVKGKLSLDVEYHIKDNQLEASNSLTIDQLTFGDKVDGPNATHLPVPFLVSLLTDSDGKINLDLPISGTLNDPQFSIGGLIVRVLVNVLEKAVTSPFSLLAHAFGGGSDEMSYIEFSAGSHILTDTAKAKLDNIAKALTDRAQMKLDIIGRADMATDEAGLRQHMLDSQVKKSSSVETVDDTPVSDADRAKAVDKIYSDAKFDKPRNVIGFAKSLPTAEMEKLIIANTKVSDDDIRALALRRESVVHAYLIDTAHIAPDRLFAIAPKLSGDGITDKGAISRVDFDLKID